MTSSLLETRKRWVADQRKAGTEGVFRASAVHLPLPPSLHDALRVPKTEHAIVVELRRSSPDAPSMAHDDIVGMAARAAEWGAAALAILPDEDAFGTSYADIMALAQQTALPIWCRDIVLDPVQIVMARAHGAAAVSLDASLHSGAELRSLYREATELGLEVVMEGSTSRALQSAAEVRLGSAEHSGARILAPVPPADDPQGALYERVIPRLPDFVVRLAGRPLLPSDDVAQLTELGYEAFLAADLVWAAPDPESAFRSCAGADATTFTAS